MAKTAKIQHFAVEEVGALSGLPYLSCHCRQESAHENGGNGNAEKKKAGKKKENHTKLELLITSLC